MAEVSPNLLLFIKLLFLFFVFLVLSHPHLWLLTFVVSKGRVWVLSNEILSHDQGLLCSRAGLSLGSVPNYFIRIQSWIPLLAISNNWPVWEVLRRTSSTSGDVFPWCHLIWPISWAEWSCCCDNWKIPGLEVSMHRSIMGYSVLFSFIFAVQTHRICRSVLRHTFFFPVCHIISGVLDDETIFRNVKIAGHCEVVSQRRLMLCEEMFVKWQFVSVLVPHFLKKIFRQMVQRAVSADACCSNGRSVQTLRWNGGESAVS